MKKIIEKRKSESKSALCNISTETLNNHLNLEDHHSKNQTTLPPPASTIRINRLNYDLEQLNNELEYSKPNKSELKECKDRCNNFNWKEILIKTFPCYHILKNYSWKNDFPNDVISGCTVTVMHIQGMGYALLANVPPVVGIYMAVFPVIFYFIFSTSRHNSMGAFAIVTIMVGKVVATYSNFGLADSLASNTTNIDMLSSDIAMRTPMQVGTAVCFLAGAFQLVMYFFRLGAISFLLSETLISGFTTGAAFQILISQMKDLIGVQIPQIKGNFEVINTLIEIFKQIKNINLLAATISCGTIIILVLFNQIVKPRMAKRTRIPFPTELLLVLLGTLCSRYFNWQDDYKLGTIGTIEKGFPQFAVPDLSFVQLIWLDSLIIAVISYTNCISLGQVLAQKQNYEIDCNQELLAIGTGNIVGSFLFCLPFAPALSRSTLQLTVGGKTQIASAVSGTILIAILLWFGPIFETLPRCVLSGIILFVLRSLLFQVTQFYTCFKLSKLDSIIWMGTFLTVTFIAIDIGLVVGVVLSLLVIFIRGIRPYACVLGNLPNTDLYLDVTRFKGTEEIPHIKIFHYCGCLNFASRSIFKSTLCNTIKINLTKELKKNCKSEKNNTKYEFTQFKYLVIDLTSLSYADTSGITALKNLIVDLNKINVNVFMAGVSCPVYETMKKCDLFKLKSDKFKLFPTLHDAVHYANDIIKPIEVISV